MHGIELQATGIEGLDEIIGGIPRGSRSLLLGPPGSGKRVFAMSFLWSGLQAGETVAWDVYDRPWTQMRRYFQSFGWDITSYEKDSRFIPIQAFPHHGEYERDPYVRYFALVDFEEMKRIDLELSKAGVTRFVFGDSYEHIFHELPEKNWHEIEQWTVNWCHHSRMTNFDIVHESRERDAFVNRLIDFTLMLANNIIRFRVREVNLRLQREFRIEKMECVSHPIDWIPFQITKKGIEIGV